MLRKSKSKNICGLIAVTTIDTSRSNEVNRSVYSLGDKSTTADNVTGATLTIFLFCPFDLHDLTHKTQLSSCVEALGGHTGTTIQNKNKNKNTSSTLNLRYNCAIKIKWISAMERELRFQVSAKQCNLILRVFN